MLYPPWLKLVVPIVIAAILFGAGWKVCAWKLSGKIEKATAAKEKAQTEAREAIAFRAACIKDVARIRQDLRLMDEARAAADALYTEAIARPPRVVVEYEDRWHEAREVIVSEDCETGLGELFDFIHSLPAYANGGAP